MEDDFNGSIRRFKKHATLCMSVSHLNDIFNASQVQQLLPDRPLDEKNAKKNQNPFKVRWLNLPYIAI